MALAFYDGSVAPQIVQDNHMTVRIASRGSPW